jgi:O-acetyl-ADP-ribose deacetylase (regulator of RNase III)
LKQNKEIKNEKEKGTGMNRIIKVKEIAPDREIKLVHGDVTEEKVDAIVNAANSHLKHGGGVAGAIVRKGGREIQEESDKIGFVPVGEAAITGSGKLPSNYVIHAVGPRWGEGDEENKLARAVQSSLQLANGRHFVSISLPAISSGIFGFPLDRCAEIILHTIETYLEKQSETSLKEIRICLFDDNTVKEFISKFSE